MPDRDDRSIADYIERGSALTRVAKFAVATVITVAGAALVVWLIEFQSLVKTGEEKARYDAAAERPDYLSMPFKEFLARTCSGKEGPRIVQCDLLLQRFCNSTAIWRAMDKYRELGNHLAAARFGEHFLASCSADDSITYETARNWYWLTEYDRARRSINSRPDLLTTSPSYASWSGFIAEAEEDYDFAAIEFERALLLFTELSDVHPGQFYHITRSLRRIGRFCEARVPLLRYLSFDPRERMTSQIRNELADLARLGSCNSDDRPENTVVLLERDKNLLLVKVWVNDTVGRFILDTGAEVVFLTKDFAEAAEIDLSNSFPAISRGIGGERNTLISKAKRVAVNEITATDVVVSVALENDALFEGGIDGLLGQSFLSRFVYTVEGDALTLRAWQ